MRSDSDTPSDQYARVLPVSVDPARIRLLSELSPIRSTLHILLEWSLIIGAAFLCWRFWNPLSYLITVAFIGARQHALIILSHEGAHYRLFRNRRLNDWVGELFLAWPLIVLSMHGYRRNHFPHHRNVNTELDPDWMRKRTPDWEFPKSPTALLRLLSIQASGIGFFRFIVIAARLPKAQTDAALKKERAFRLARLPYLVLLGCGIYLLGLGKPFLLFWIIPFLTWTQLAFQIRSIAEHFGMPKVGGVYGETRTVVPTIFDRLFLVPKNVGYHIEHHLYPSVPFYRLPALHRILMEGEEYRSSAVVTAGYLRLLGELAQRPSA